MHQFSVFLRFKDKKYIYSSSSGKMRQKKNTRITSIQSTGKNRNKWAHPRWAAWRVLIGWKRWSQMTSDFRVLVGRWEVTLGHSGRRVVKEPALRLLCPTEGNVIQKYEVLKDVLRLVHFIVLLLFFLNNYTNLLTVWRRLNNEGFCVFCVWMRKRPDVWSILVSWLAS